MKQLNIASHFKRFMQSRDGNFAMMTAIVAPMLVMAGSLSLDVANMMSMKTRAQAVSDAVSLTVINRLSTGDVTKEQAKTLASQLFIAQMSQFSSRYDNLVTTPQVTITPATNTSEPSWTINIAATVTMDTSPFASFFSKSNMSASVGTTAIMGEGAESEILQGALSMVSIVDVSGSMGWSLSSSQSTTQETASALGISTSAANNTNRYINNVYNYGVSLEGIEWIINNYTYSECYNMSRSRNSRRNFLNNIGLSTRTGWSRTRNICQNATYGVYQGASAQNLIDHLSNIVGGTKMDALKEAAEALFDQFNEADPNQKYVRTGLSAYSSYVRGYTNMEWGTSSAASYVANTYASGGTASTNSVRWAYDQLKSSNSTEVNAHEAKNGDNSPDRFILFMTDGENNYYSDDTSTLYYCTQAKNDGIEIYTVAFDAPTRGQNLLRSCATSSDHYFEAETSEELIKAFEEIGKSTVSEVPRLTN